MFHLCPRKIRNSAFHGQFYATFQKITDDLMSKLNKIPNMLSSEHIEILQVCTLFNLVIWFKIENEILNNMQICYFKCNLHSKDLKHR